jgi:hypothetical protein
LIPHELISHIMNETPFFAPLHVFLSTTRTSPEQIKYEDAIAPKHHDTA